jgi:hypothetical protein
MSRNTPRAIRYGIIIILVIFGVGYALFNSRIFIKGPQLTVISPIDGTSLFEKKISISGNTFNTSFISVNDRAISIDEQGNFEVPILLQDGYNQVVIKAHDKFDRQVTQTLDLVYNSSNQSE